MLPLKPIAAYMQQKIIACREYTSSATTVFILQIKLFGLSSSKRANVSRKLDIWAEQVLHKRTGWVGLKLGRAKKGVDKFQWGRWLKPWMKL